MALNIYMTTWKYVQGESFKTLGIWIKKNLPRDQNKVDSMAGVNAYNFDQNVSRNELARMIILQEYPLSTADHIDFRKYSTSLQPLFMMVSRNTIKKDILSIYEKTREKSKHEIDKN